MKKALLYLLLFGLISPSTSFGQYISVGSITVQYSNPGVNNNLEVIADLFYSSSCCGRIGYSSIIINDTLYLSACYFSGPTTTPSLMKDTLQVGSMPSGIRGLHFRAYYSWNQSICDSTAFTKKTVAFIVQNPTGISTITQNSGIEIYPNPVTDFLHISGNSVTQLNLYDLQGRLIKRYDFEPKNSIEIPASDLPAGIYAIEIISRDGVITRKRLVKY